MSDAENQPPKASLSTGTRRSIGQHSEADNHSLSLAMEHHNAGRLAEAETRYREILLSNPNHPDALHLLGTVALQRGNYQEAADLIAQAIAINPNNAAFYSNRGIALKELKQLEQAVASYDEAIRLNPSYAAAHANRGLALNEIKQRNEALTCDQALNLAMEHHSMGRLAEAEVLYQQILQADPNQPDALHLLGAVAAQTGKFQAAVDFIAQAIAINPNNAAYYSNRGNALQELKQLDAAIASYDMAIDLNPDYAEAFSNRGNALKALNRHEEALASYDTAIQLYPDYADAHYNRGYTLKKLGKLDEAIASYDTAIRINPNHAAAHTNKGNALQETRRLGEAIASYDAAIQIDPHHAEAFSNRGDALKGLGQLDEAIVNYDTAIRIKPDFAEAYSNLGNAQKELGQLDAAIVSYDTAIKINPNYAEAYWHKSLILLLCGDFENGWKLYEWRWKNEILFGRQALFKQPYLNGSDLKNELRGATSRLSNKKLLVWMEQGIGDEIMFASLLPDLENSLESFVVECEERLLPLLQRSFPKISFAPRTEPPAPQLFKDTVHYQTSIGEFGQCLRSEIKYFPMQRGYLKADSNKFDQIFSDYNRRWPGKLRVGISWHTSNAKRGSQRSLPLHKWQPIIGNTDCTFISLQYGDVDNDLLALKEHSGISVFNDRSVDPIIDMDTFAAQIAALDLVISIDNSTAHLAGALGVPTWMFVPYIPDWRWFLDGDDSPWYGSLKMYRQGEDQDWGPVIDRISQDLEGLRQ